MPPSTRTKGKLVVIHAVPGSTILGPIVTDFCRRGEGVISAFNDSALPSIKQYVDEDLPIEVLTFGELVYRVLQLCGEEGYPLVQGGHYETAVSYACRSVPESSPFRRTAQFGGFHKALVRTLKELHAWGIDDQGMDHLAGHATSRLAEKLKSLANIDRGVNEVLRTLGRQTHHQQLAACQDATPERDGTFTRLLVLAGSDLHPMRLQWLKWAAQNGTEVMLMVDRHASNAPIFLAAQPMVTSLGGVVQERGDGNLLTRNLFARDASGGPPLEVEIVSMADPLAESEWTLRACLSAESPSHCAVFVRDLEGYAPLLEAAAKRIGVPVRIARRAPLLTNSFARLTLAALEFCAGRDVRALLPMLKSSYMGLSGDQQNQVSSALREAHSQREKSWDALAQWAQSAPPNFAWIRTLLEWRQRAISSRFGLREWQSLVSGLLNESKLPWSTRREQGKLAMSERDLRARNQLERLLTHYVSVESVMADRSLSLWEIVRICGLIWRDADVSIPSADFGVLVTDQVDALNDSQQLHIMGMLEGVFPRRRSEEPILTDEERSEISRLRSDFPPLPDSHSIAAAERDVFYRVCSAAKKKLVLSYPQADDQRDNIPAFYLEEVKRAMGGRVVTHDYPRLQFSPEEDDCIALSDRLLREALDASRELPPPNTLSTVSALAEVKTPTGVAFEPRQLRDALECPFRYVVRHRLKIEVRRPVARWHSLTKLPQSVGLLGLSDPIKAETVLLGALEAELDGLYAEVEEWELQLLRSGGRRIIREWVQRETAARQIWPKETDSVKMNPSFGDGIPRRDFWNGIELRGGLPAISRFQNYNVVHLYRSTMPPDKNWSEVEQLYFGLHLLSVFEKGREVALEVDATKGDRTLFVLTRAGGTAIGNLAARLKVAAIEQTEIATEGQRKFFGEVRKLAQRAGEAAWRGDIVPVNGKHCSRCEYGELCRRSQRFGEEDSPFGSDITSGGTRNLGGGEHDST